MVNWRGSLSFQPLAASHQLRTQPAELQYTLRPDMLQGVRGSVVELRPDPWLLVSRRSLGSDIKGLSSVSN